MERKPAAQNDYWLMGVHPSWASFQLPVHVYPCCNNGWVAAIQDANAAIHVLRLTTPCFPSIGTGISLGSSPRPSLSTACLWWCSTFGICCVLAFGIWWILKNWNLAFGRRLFLAFGNWHLTFVWCLAFLAIFGACNWHYLTFGIGHLFGIRHWHLALAVLAFGFWYYILGVWHSFHSAVNDV